VHFRRGALSVSATSLQLPRSRHRSGSRDPREYSGQKNDFLHRSGHRAWAEKSICSGCTAGSGSTSHFGNRFGTGVRGHHLRRPARAALSFGAAPDSRGKRRLCERSMFGFEMNVKAASAKSAAKNQQHLFGRKPGRGPLDKAWGEQGRPAESYGRPDSGGGSDMGGPDCRPFPFNLLVDLEYPEWQINRPASFGFSQGRPMAGLADELNRFFTGREWGAQRRYCGRAAYYITGTGQN